MVFGAASSSVFYLPNLYELPTTMEPSNPELSSLKQSSTFIILETQLMGVSWEHSAGWFWAEGL